MKDTYLLSLFDKGTQQLKNEKFVYEKDFNFNYTDFNVLVTKEKDYYNIYILCEMFIKEPLNTLQEQIPINSISEEEIINPRFLEFKALEFYLWSKYGNPSKDEVLSFNIEVNK